MARLTLLFLLWIFFLNYESQLTQQRGHYILHGYPTIGHSYFQASTTLKSKVLSSLNDKIKSEYLASNPSAWTTELLWPSKNNERQTIIIIALTDRNIRNVHCGRFKRIIHGEKTDIEKAPYMLSMRLNNKHICGASIIGRYWSITASHCCIYSTGKYLKRLSMRSGSANLYGSGTVHTITKVVRYFKYEVNDDNYDICVVKVAEPGFEFSKVVAPVKLPNSNNYVGLYDKESTVSGWGYYKVDENKLSPILRSIKMTKVNLKLCRYLYRDRYTIHNCNICYASKDEGADACQGDSGGPLVNVNSILIGIVSFGDDCSDSKLPEVFTDVRQFRGWINNVTGL